MVSERASQRAFFGVSALLLVAGPAVTIVWCVSMSARCKMQLPTLARAPIAFCESLFIEFSHSASECLRPTIISFISIQLASARRARRQTL
jgi:hypothetical protein